MRCVKLNHFNPRWFKSFRFFRVVQSAQFWQSFLNDCQPFFKRMGHSAHHAQLAKHATKCHDIPHHQSTWYNITQRDSASPSYPHPCQFEQFQHLSQVLPDESFLQNWFSAWYDFLKIVAGCSNVQTVANWFTPASVCATFANVQPELRNLRAWRKMNQFVSTDSFRHTVLTCINRYNYNSW